MISQLRKGQTVNNFTLFKTKDTENGTFNFFSKILPKNSLGCRENLLIEPPPKKNNNRKGG
jgi:hypothetical protein